MTWRGAGHAAAWTTPALLAAVAARVASGHPEGPLLVLLAVAAPLVALVRPRAPAALNPVTRLVLLAVVALVVWANVIVFADVASRLGAARWQGAVLAATLALLVTVWPAADRGRGSLLIIGIAGLLAVVASAAVATGHTPWSAWTEVASRAALVFSERGAGTRFSRDTTLELTEVHHVTALKAATFRVAEQAGSQTVVREWLLRDNDVLTLRPGDRLWLPAGAHVRFEAGKRVPGAPASGAQWADAPGRHAARALPAGLGLAITLLGGAAALVPPWTRAARRPAALAPLAGAGAAVSGGIYAVAVAPELALPDASGAVLVGLARALPYGGAAALLAVAALLALLFAGAQALRPRVTEAARGSAPAAWAGLFALAAAAGAWTIDPWTVLSAALGLGACAWAAPLLGAGDGDTAGGVSPAALGSITGALAFGALAALAARLPEWAGVIGDYPALLAAPLAWAVAFRARRPSARRGGGTARSPSATSGR